MPRIKIQLQDGIKRVFTIDTDATKGSTLGTDLYLPDGSVATPASLLAWIGEVPTSGGSGSGNSGPSLSSVLTTKGDLATRDAAPQRLPIGTTGQALVVSAGGLPVWDTISGTSGANPTASVGLTAVNGVATTFMRSDAAPPLSQAITPTWTNLHTFSNGLTLSGGTLTLPAGSVADSFLTSNVPLKNAANTFTDAQVLSKAGAATWTITNSADGITTYIGSDGAQGFIGTATAHALRFYANNADRGAITAAGGFVWGSPTGGDQGAGTLNATGLFVNGVAVSTGSGVTPAALTKTDDTNVTLTLGGTPATSLLQATSLTLGWSGQLAVARGGTGAATLTGYVKGNGTSAFTASATIPYSDISGTPTIPTVTDGTYTPTLTNVSNAGSLTNVAAQWMRVGNTVTVSVAFTYAPSGSIATRIGVSLPVASALTSKGQLAGAVGYEYPSGYNGGVAYADATNDRAEIGIGNIGTGFTAEVFAQFTYLVI